MYKIRRGAHDDRTMKELVDRGQPESATETNTRACGEEYLCSRFFNSPKSRLRRTARKSPRNVPAWKTQRSPDRRTGPIRRAEGRRRFLCTTRNKKMRRGGAHEVFRLQQYHFYRVKQNASGTRNHPVEMSDQAIATLETRVLIQSGRNEGRLNVRKRASASG